jgi:hypothetical protein
MYSLNQEAPEHGDTKKIWEKFMTSEDVILLRP